MRRYPFVVLLPVLLLGGLGVAFGLHREPTYTATAQDVVQAFAPTISQLPGAIQAAQDLATNQSRLIDSADVIGPLARTMGSTPGSIERRLSATPVPNSTVIRIDAQSSSATGSVALANAAAKTFARYANAATQSDTQAEQVLKQFQLASAAYTRALLAKQSVQAADKTAASTALVDSTAAVDAAQLRRQALSAQYQSLVQSHGTAPKIETFVVARNATSDRSSGLQVYVFAGAVAGLLIGAAFATLLANRRSRRQIT
jgi:hypothetical protein